MGKPGNSGANRYSRVSVGQPQDHKASWEDAEADTIWRVIYRVTNAGDAVMFSKTRDGGACVITLMTGDDRVKQYATGPEELAKLLALVLASVEE